MNLFVSVMIGHPCLACSIPTVDDQPFCALHRSALSAWDERNLQALVRRRNARPTCFCEMYHIGQGVKRIGDRLLKRVRISKWN